MTTIDKVLPRRSDLSTSLVHLTRSNKRQTAKEVLRTIIEDSRLVAGSRDYKDFHWEREWRCVGDFYLPSRYMVIAPEEEHGEMKKHIEDWVDEPQKVRLIDAMWSLEVTIARLAGFRKDDL